MVGDLRDVFRLLHQLDHPKQLDCLELELDDCSVMDVSQLIVPYFRNHLRGLGGSQDVLELFLSFDSSVSLRARVASATKSQPADIFVTITLELNEVLHKDAQEQVILDLLAHAPREEIVHLEAAGNPVTTENTFPNLRVLSFDRIPLSPVFPEPDGNNGFLLSLQRLSLRKLAVDGGDWTPLTTFLSCRASSGNRLDTLEIFGSPHMCPATVDVVRGMVRELKIDNSNPLCPFGTCPEVAATDT